MSINFAYVGDFLFSADYNNDNDEVVIHELPMSYVGMSGRDWRDSAIYEEGIGTCYQQGFLHCMKMLARHLTARCEVNSVDKKVWTGVHPGIPGESQPCLNWGYDQVWNNSPGSMNLFVLMFG